MSIPALTLQRLLVLALLLGSVGTIIWAYWPGQYGPWLLDDRANLDILRYVEPSFASALDYIFSNASGPLGRPVSMVSFVVERLLFGTGTGVGKLVNIGLHAANGLMVAWLFTLLLSHKKVPRAAMFGCLAAAAWMLAPLHVSTVLYVVQRMAMLATFFSLAFLVTYVYWRQHLAHLGRAGALTVALVLLLLLAVYAKENSVVVVPIALLLECLWFRGMGTDGRYRFWLDRGSATIFVLAILSLPILIVWGWDWVQAGYKARSFTLEERLLTEARVMWDYVGQLIWPDLTGMGIYHDDYTVSRSLSEPTATLAAVLAWGGVIVLATLCCFFRPGKALAFCILWFLIGHAVESSVLALELYFEHRNYFPSVGLFLLMGLFLGKLAAQDKGVAAPLLLLLLCYLVVVASKTSSQAQLWSSGPLIRMNAVNHHPRSFRANQDMAIQLASVGALDEALSYSQVAHGFSDRGRQGDYQIFDIALHCLAGRGIPFSLLHSLGNADPGRPFAVVSTMNGLFRILRGPSCPGLDRVALADRLAEIFLRAPTPMQASANIFALFASFENDLQRYENAYKYTELFLASAPNNIRGLLMQLHFAVALQRRVEAQRLKKRLSDLELSGHLDTAQKNTLRLYD
ncbi:MAG: hypothetical protein ACJA09_000499 [Alcanivorax sp.]|jgi:hypothetical protein